jgi:hypothetical protein
MSADARQATSTNKPGVQVTQLECRDLPRGGTLAPGEKLVAGRACRPVGTPLQVSVSPRPGEAPASVTAAPAVRIPAASPALPSESGMYLATTNSFTKILGQIVDFSRTGSLLVSGLTVGIKTSKTNVQLLGPHAQTVTSSRLEFYFIPAKQEADAGVNAGDFILIRLEQKPERRQFEIAARGVLRASAGISITHQIQLTRSEVTAGVYKILPADGLADGEYGLYLSRGEGMAPYIFDFSVQNEPRGNRGCCVQP